MRKSCLLSVFVLVTSGMIGCHTAEQSILPGKLPNGRFRLPNGWLLSPAGKQVEVGELPLNMAVSPDGQYILVTNNGTKAHTLSIVDTHTWSCVQTIPIRKAWIGVRWYDDGKGFAVSCGNDNQINLYQFTRGHAALSDSILLGNPWPAQKIWVAGIDADFQSSRLFAVGKQDSSLSMIDLTSRTVAKRARLPATPYTCLFSKNHNMLFVSLWGASSLALVDPTSLEIARTINVGDHPNDMVESPTGNTLFVANANNNTVSVIDLEKWTCVETITTSLSPNAPPGSTPNSVTLNDRGDRLFIANADNNYVTVVDVSQPGNSRPAGFIPVGWYPTCVRYLPGRHQIAVANGKGLSSRANPQGPNPNHPSSQEQYIATLFRGDLSLIDDPSPDRLAEYTEEVYANSTYTDARRDAPGNGDSNPVPRRVGEASPIKYIFYIIKENRTYDQVFGDIKEGNGDSTLCLFPDHITPNHHALVRQFVLLDNFYADAEVSADGHNWSMAAYATDYVEKTWPTMYGGRGGEYDYEGGNPLDYPSGGYIWGNCKRHGVTFRSYGEFANNGANPEEPATAAIPSLEGHIAPHYRGWDLTYSDEKRATDWLSEFRDYEKNGDLPQFQTIKLPNDHTSGTRKGTLTPRAYVAQNDLALGQIVEAISHSIFWKQSAIFVVEDDAQNGPDHVDAHRTVALVISPYAKHGEVDSDMYSTSSMVRTVELILGLPPMSQFDAAATPMYNSFTMAPDAVPFNHREANIDLEERNPEGAIGQIRSEEMNFSREDAIPDIELNEIIWKSVRGEESEMPAPVRSAFVRVKAED
jgi:YVTN family beta-propeller protein